jgi:hypothetical protein
MTTREVEVVLAASRVEIDTCVDCRLFWFDRYESNRLTPRAVLELFQYIAGAKAARAQLASAFACPRCESRLAPTHDMQRTTPFTYWRCDFNHGRLISFNQFLREKNFVRTPSPVELRRLRDTVRQISCSQCGAPIDLACDSACSHCGAPIALIDPDSVAKAIADLKATISAAPDAGEATRKALYDAQIEAIFSEERQRLHPEREERHVDLVTIGATAIGALLGSFLAER